MPPEIDYLVFFFWLTPFMRWLPLLDRRTLRGDFSAALTGALVVLPQGVAFATIAGMPPSMGCTRVWFRQSLPHCSARRCILYPAQPQQPPLYCSHR